MNLAWQNFWKHPLSTLMGLFTLLGGSYTVLMTDPDYAPLRDRMPVKWAGRAALAVLLVKFFMRGMQKDVGREEVKVPGQAGTEMVAAHETPDEAGAKVVTPEAK